MADKKSAGTISKTARRSTMGETGRNKTIEPKAIAWAWEKGIKVGTGRKPDFYLFTDEEVKTFDPVDFIVIRANSAWVGSAGSSPTQKRK